jgi:hypothetical protein
MKIKTNYINKWICPVLEGGSDESEKNHRDSTSFAIGVLYCELLPV